jgi:transaldolase
MRMSSPIFLDTIDEDAIAWYLSLGILGGVTTNPTLGTFDYLKIAKLIDPLPLSLEVITNGVDMLDQARSIAMIAPNVVVKIPVHGPDGETENLDVIRRLFPANIVNATAIMSPIQGLAAALAGASYVSLFAGRVANMGYDATREISKLRTLLDAHSPRTKIIAASSREAYNITEWLLAGADIVTVTPEILRAALVHPYTKETVRQFLEAAK